LESPELTARLRRNGPARAANFDIAGMVEAYTDLFLEQAASAPGALAVGA
jgi:hypothetical protein